MVRVFQVSNLLLTLLADENRKKQEVSTAKQLATMQRNKQAREQPASAPPPAEQTPPLPRPGGLTTPLPPAPLSRQNVPQAPTMLPRLDLAGPGPFRRTPATPASLGPEPRRPLQLVNNGQTQYPDFSQYRPPVAPQLPASQSPASSLVSASSQSSLSSSSPDFRQDPSITPSFTQSSECRRRTTTSHRRRLFVPRLRPTSANTCGTRSIPQGRRCPWRRRPRKPHSTLRSGSGDCLNRSKLFSFPLRVRAYFTTATIQY